jgi:hypothetical protein
VQPPQPAEPQANKLKPPPRGALLDSLFSPHLLRG